MNDITVEEARVLKDDMSQPYPIRSLAAAVVNADESASDARTILRQHEQALGAAKAELTEWLNKAPKTPKGAIERLWYVAVSSRRAT